MSVMTTPLPTSGIVTLADFCSNGLPVIGWSLVGRLLRAVSESAILVIPVNCNATFADGLS